MDWTLSDLNMSEISFNKIKRIITDRRVAFFFIFILPLQLLLPGLGTDCIRWTLENPSTHTVSLSCPTSTPSSQHDMFLQDAAWNSSRFRTYNGFSPNQRWRKSLEISWRWVFEWSGCLLVWASHSWIKYEREVMQQRVDLSNRPVFLEGKRLCKRNLRDCVSAMQKLWVLIVSWVKEGTRRNSN